MDIVPPVAGSCSPVSLYADLAAGGHRGGAGLAYLQAQLRPPSLLVEGVRLGKNSLLVWGLSPPVRPVERLSREDQGPHNIRFRCAPSPVLFNELVGGQVPTK